MKLAALAVVAACGSSAAPKDAAVDGDRPAVAIPPPAPPFEVAPPQDKIVSLGRSERFACVVRASGGVDCWGQLGWGRPEPVPRRIPGVTDARAISLDASCVLRATGDVACLAGDRIEFIPDIAGITALGTGDPGCHVGRGSVICAGQPAPGITDAIAVTEGNDFVCAVRKSGDVVCGVGKYGAPPAAFQPLAALGRVRKLVLARSYSSSRGCAILETGELRCFAITGGFELSDVDGEGKSLAVDPSMTRGATDVVVYQSEPLYERRELQIEAIVGGKVVRRTDTGWVALPLLADAVALAPGCALRAQGSVVCWGGNAGGALGQPTTIGRSRRPPATVVGVADVASLALAGADSWAITRAGRLFHWGRHGDGFAKPVALPAGMTGIAALATTDHGATCALVAGGAVWCWTPAAPAFARLHDFGVRAIAGEGKRLVALHADGTVVRTQLVPADQNEGALVQPPSAPADTVALAGSKYYTCALQRGGRVASLDKTWTAVPQIAGATQLVTSSFEGCALAV